MHQVVNIRQVVLIVFWIDLFKTFKSRANLLSIFLDSYYNERKINFVQL